MSAESKAFEQQYRDAILPGGEVFDKAYDGITNLDHSLQSAKNVAKKSVVPVAIATTTSLLATHPAEAKQLIETTSEKAKEIINENTLAWIGMTLCLTEELVEGTNIKNVPQILVKGAAGWLLGEGLAHAVNNPSAFSESTKWLGENLDTASKIVGGVYAVIKTTSFKEFKEGLSFISNRAVGIVDKVILKPHRESSTISNKKELDKLLSDMAIGRPGRGNAAFHHLINKGYSIDAINKMVYDYKKAKK